MPKLQEADDSWRSRKKETAGSGNPRFEAEMSHAALTLFQQLVVGQKASGLGQWEKGLIGVSTSSNDLLPVLEHHIQKLSTSRWYACL
ncbi:hypothetical protein KC19_2G138400 [Ceratodon purpureus]|uniref:Uncharacterized protein n=1 Tax=Ceratodon purpureus TaxID=3225 RepID=A0A8T0IW55_CERPU|nr:hypothetical protein KC19_7G062500 [Ceratodon purpureus]KAG0587066.1 hypothetical protein KC19_2G138400 [Ceratodon purpureus]